MKRILLLFTFSLLLISTLGSHAQKTLILQPDPLVGEDATLLNRTDLITTNQGNDVNMYMGGWTGNQQGSSNHDGRSLIRFVQLNELISQKVQVNSAKLVLYSSTVRWFSRRGENAGKLFLVIQDWDENTVTWNTQPAYDATTFAPTPMFDVFDTVVIDVSTLVQKIVHGIAPNYGFLYKLNSEEPSRSVEVTSSDYTVDAKRRPKLIVTYNNIVTDLENVPARNARTEVYPNPAMNDLFVSHPESVVSFTLHSGEGAMIKQGESIQAHQDVSDLPKGLYVLRLKTQNETVSFKFVKL